MKGLPRPELFWTKVKPSKDSDCWLWTGYRDKDGYGILTVNGKHWRANRAAYTLANGPIPDGRLILHNCDTPPCCRPTHLKPGTAADNAADRIARNRDILLALRRLEMAGQMTLALA